MGDDQDQAAKERAEAAAFHAASNAASGIDVSAPPPPRARSPSPRRDSNDQDKDGSHSYNVVKIFVGGLPSTCDNDKLLEYFGKYGSIKDSVVMMDRETQRPRGFGYCTFNEPSSVEQVMAEYKEHRIDGKWVETKRCIPQEQMRGGGSSKGSGRDGGRGRDDRGGRDGGRGRDDRDGRDSRSGSMGQQPQAQGYPGYPPNDPYAAWYAHAAACQAKGQDPYAAYYAQYGMQQPQAAYGQPQAYGYPAQGGYPGYPQGYPGAYGMPGGYGQDPRMQAYGGMPPPGAPPPSQAALPAHDGGRSRDRSRDRRRSRSRSR